MDDDKTMNEFLEFLDWRGEEEDYSLQLQFENDMPCFLWDEISQNESGQMYTLDKQTPIRECTAAGCCVLNVEDDSLFTDNKDPEDCKELSLLKRRRMLHYDVNNADQIITSAQVPSSTKVKEPPHLDDSLKQNLDGIRGFSGDYCTTGDEAFQLSETCLYTSYGDPDINSWCSEMMPCENIQRQVNHSGQCSAPSTKESHHRTNNLMASPRIKFKGRKSGTMNTMSIISTSVAHPFALVKPFCAQGDVTLTDINRRIHSPAPVRQQTNDDESWMCVPVSAISGKPIVAKTKVRTEGKGSIIITRTKG